MHPHPQLVDRDADIERLRRWQADDHHGEVLKLVERLLRDDPADPELLLIAARSLRFMREVDRALGCLERLEAICPGSCRMQEERGLCHVQLRDAPRATAALERAVAINPMLPQSWQILSGLYRMDGNVERADAAALAAARMAGIAPAVREATALFSDGQLDRAETIIRSHLVADDHDIEGMRLLARIGMATEVLDDAETLLAAVVEIAPSYDEARYDYAQVLLARQKFQALRGEADTLLRNDPERIEYRALRAAAAVGLGRLDEAIATYRDMAADRPADPEILVWLGNALKADGHTPEAIGAYLDATQCDGHGGEAFWSLSNLKSYRFAKDQIAEMRRAEAAPSVGFDDRVFLCFALGKAFEDAKDFPNSWAYYERGNALKRSRSPYRKDLLDQEVADGIATCTASFFDERRGAGCADPDPIFIVGLPRSGSTLLEQVLASHSQVEATHELADLQRIVLDLKDREAVNPATYPRVVDRLEREHLADLGAAYLDGARQYRRESPYFIDKMPNNFRYVGLIHLILPNAKIIDIRREPMSCCFSNLKQLFVRGQEFTYSIPDISAYYRSYLAAMNHWDSVLPGRILRIHYEDLVNDLAGNVERLLRHCGLPFERACLDFHTSQRHVSTPSSEQVRQPIYRHGLEAWRPYEPWLAPLREALGTARRDYRG